jgi:hypothetical protein
MAYFQMNGGTIDATADGTCAIDVYNDNCQLENGVLIGQHLVPDSIYGQVSTIEVYIPDSGNYNSFAFSDWSIDYRVCFSGNSSQYPVLLCYEIDSSGSDHIFRSDLVTLYTGGEA